MLELADHWIWDSWYVTHKSLHHMFFLRASRALRDPDLRHEHASIGHAVSSDYATWTLLPDALVASDGPAWDDLATWTGCTVRGTDGRWYMFYTGISREHGTRIQRLGVALSDDLISWERHGTSPIAEPDPRWYETGPSNAWHERAWRDPWVFADPNGGWHMYITARAAEGPHRDRGVVGHAWSPDLLNWQVLPPLSAPGGFGQLEVIQLVQAAGRSYVLFSCAPNELGSRTPEEGMVYLADGDGPLGPFDVAGARVISLGDLYAGRIVDTNSGKAILAFKMGAAGRFGGFIPNPVPIDFAHDGWMLSDERAPN